MDKKTVLAQIESDKSTLPKHQNRTKTQNTSPNFGYIVQKLWTKVWTVEKRDFYNVLFFCKFKLSEMMSGKNSAQCTIKRLIEIKSVSKTK